MDDEHAETRTDDDEGGKKNELEEMEEELKKAVERREAGEKTEGTLSKGKGPLTKKTKKGAPGIKRPAAAMDTPEFSAKAHKVAKDIDMRDIFRRLPDRMKEKGMKRGKLVGWVYGHGRRRAELQGARDEVCKEVGSIMSAKAGKILGGKL